MGTVYLALDTILEREVALKVLNPSLAADESFIDRFRLEARALARLNHQAIVRVFDADWVDKQLYIVMEYVPGGSLEDLLRKEGNLQTDQIIEILAEVAEGLDYAHETGLIHRDIKPGNILLTEKGAAQITDFGLVKDADVSLTAAGQMLGTPAYMAPEQIQGEAVGPTLDIYALGIVCYEMFAGQTPFRGTISAVFEGHLLRVPPPIRQFNPSVPFALQEVVLTALEKSPNDRYQRASDFIQALRDAYVESQKAGATVVDAGLESPRPVAAPPSSSERPPEAPVSSQRQSRPPSSGPVSRPSQSRPPSGAIQPPQRKIPSGSRTRSSNPNIEQKPRRRFVLGVAGTVGLIVAGLICVASVVGLYIYGDQIFGLTPPATSTPLPAILYEYNFEAQIGTSFPTQELPEGTIEYAQGGYRIQVDQVEWYFWGTVDRTYNNVTVEVDATNLGSMQNNEFGIVCRYLTRDDFYYAYVNSDGLYGIAHWLNGEIEVISDPPPAPTSAINPGTSLNRLRVDCDGADMRLYANGIFLTRVVGAINSPTGDVGVIAAAPFQPGTDVLFDNFVVTEARK